MSIQNRIALKVEWAKGSYFIRDVWPIVTPTHKEIEVYKNWCKENIGANNWNYYGLYRQIPCEFRFKLPEDLLAFRLTFGL